MGRSSRREGAENGMRKANSKEATLGKFITPKW